MQKIESFLKIKVFIFIKIILIRKKIDIQNAYFNK